MGEWGISPEEMRKRMRDNPRERYCEHKDCGKRIGRWREHPFCDAHEYEGHITRKEKEGSQTKPPTTLPSLQYYREHFDIPREALAKAATCNPKTLVRAEAGEMLGYSTASRVLGGLRKISGADIYMADLRAKPPRSQAEGAA